MFYLFNFSYLVFTPCTTLNLLFYTSRPFFTRVKLITITIVVTGNHWDAWVISLFASSISLDISIDSPLLYRLDFWSYLSLELFSIFSIIYLTHLLQLLPHNFSLSLIYNLAISMRNPCTIISVFSRASFLE